MKATFSPPRVKICGITCWEDALAAVTAGADALGFNFVPEAPAARRIAPERAREIVRQLPPFVAAVALVSDATLEQVACVGRFTAIQYYGERDVGEIASATGLRVIAPVLLASEADLAAIESYRGRAAAVLLDARVPGRLGGTGRTIPWEWAARARTAGVPIILAGGLTPENVAAAVRIAQPYAVDVSSGVEASPGRKDPRLLRAFVRAVRSVEITPDAIPREDDPP